MHIDLILTVFEFKSFLGAININSPDLPSAFLFIEKIQSETFCLSVFQVDKLKLPIKTTFENLDDLKVVISFLFMSEGFECSMK